MKKIGIMVNRIMWARWTIMQPFKIRIRKTLKDGDIDAVRIQIHEQNTKLHMFTPKKGSGHNRRYWHIKTMWFKTLMPCANITVKRNSAWWDNPSTWEREVGGPQVWAEAVSLSNLDFLKKICSAKDLAQHEGLEFNCYNHLQERGRENLIFMN